MLTRLRSSSGWNNQAESRTRKSLRITCPLLLHRRMQSTLFSDSSELIPVTQCIIFLNLCLKVRSVSNCCNTYFFSEIRKFSIYCQSLSSVPRMGNCPFQYAQRWGIVHLKLKKQSKFPDVCAQGKKRGGGGGGEGQKNM